MLIVCTQFLCVLFVMISNALASTEVQATPSSLLAMESPKLVFPRNISHYYQGTWHFMNESKSDSIGFTKQVGHTSFTMTNVEFTSEVDHVQGEMVLRDGAYSTDENIVYFLRGAYFWQTGSLLLLANPQEYYNKAYFSNLTFDANTTFTQAVENAELALVVSTQNFSIAEGRSNCPFRLHIQVQPLSPNAIESTSLAKTADVANNNNEPRLEMSGLFGSPQCNSYMQLKAASVPLSHFHSKWKKYVVMVSASSFIQILVLVKQMEYTGTQAGASRVSQITVAMQAVLDSYLCLIHLTAGILINTLFSAFATAAFFQFITFSLFEMRYLLIILKARRQASEGWEELRREFSLFYLRFYTLLVGGFALVYYCSALFNAFLFLMYSFWVPQIICNAHKCARRTLLWEYVVGMSVTRLAVPLYFFGCPHNFVLLEPNYPMAIFLALWVSVQVLILHLQEVLGPQFFIPKGLMPAKYDYHRPLYANMSEDQRNCVICMCEVEFSDRNHMITPCDHVFHGKCLQQWFEFKEECPTCRRSLPPP